MAIAILLSMSAAVLPARAQVPEVTWERLGDLPHDQFNWPLSAGPDGYLWGGFNAAYMIGGQQVFFQGLYRLPPPYDAFTPWEKVADPPRGSLYGAYVVARDTVVLDGTSGLFWSGDGGQSWVTRREINGLAQIMEIPRGVPHAGRLVAAGLSGVTVSDDGGFTWRPTPEFAYFQQDAACVAALRGQAPDGSDRLVTLLNDLRSGDDSLRVSVSDDGGETWERGAGVDPGVFPTCVEVVDLGEGRAAAVMARGPVWWTGDAGETWSRWAEWEDLVPTEEAPDGDARSRWAVVAPDGRLVVGLQSNNPETAIWDKRTSAPVRVVASDRQPEAERLHLTAHPNPSRQRVELALSDADRQPFEVVVVDAQGREVARREVSASSSWRLDVSGWAPGVYLARVGKADRVAFTVIR